MFRDPVTSVESLRAIIGGDALVAARFLYQRGAIVGVSMVQPRDPNSLAARHARTIERLGIPTMEAPHGVDPSADVLVDGLFGIGIRLPLRDPAPRIIEAIAKLRQVPMDSDTMVSGREVGICFGDVVP